MKKGTKGTIITAAALAVLAAIFAAIWIITQKPTEEGVKNYTLTVVHSDGGVKDFSLKTEEEYLGAALLNEGLISGTVSEYGLMVEYVDGEAAIWNENGAYWALYIGEEYATTGADSTPVTEGGAYKWVYTVG